MLILREQLTIDREVQKHFEANRRFLEQHPGTPMPPVPMMVDAQGHWSYDMYWRSGLKMARRIAGWLAEFLEARPLRYLEWGCGPARILRHLPALPGGDRHAYTGTDYNPATIEWCRRAFPAMRFEQNDLSPPLPFADGAFDFVFSRSVFTHLGEENGLGWMAELRRVVAPRGVVCFSTCGDFYLRKLSDEADRDRYLAGQPVVSERDREGQKLFSIKHPPAWVRARLLDGFDLLRFIPGEATQDIWIARRGARP